MAKRYEFQGSQPVSVPQEAGQEVRAGGHRARLAVVGDRMWEEIGMVVPCTAAGSWLTLRRTIPEEARDQKTAMRKQKGPGGQPALTPEPSEAGPRASRYVS